MVEKQWSDLSSGDIHERSRDRDPLIPLLINIYLPSANLSFGSQAVQRPAAQGETCWGWHMDVP